MTRIFKMYLKYSRCYDAKYESYTVFMNYILKFLLVYKTKNKFIKEIKFKFNIRIYEYANERKGIVVFLKLKIGI